MTGSAGTAMDVLVVVRELLEGGGGLEEGSSKLCPATPPGLLVSIVGFTSVSEIILLELRVKSAEKPKCP